MQIPNNNPLDLAGDDGEVISVKFTSLKANDNVAFSLDGASGGILPNPFSFKLNKAANDPSFLTLTFTFAGQGGRFDITVSGSNGGPPSVFIFKQFGVPSGSIVYAIDVL